MNLRTLNRILNIADVVLLVMIIAVAIAFAAVTAKLVLQ